MVKINYLLTENILKRKPYDSFLLSVNLIMALQNVFLDSPGKRVLLTTNEAIARGLIEGGLQMAAAYPGTPSTEIMETLIKASEKFKFYTEWSVNEKVATEVAIAGSMSNLRSMVAMKCVGVNVAAEPIIAFCLMGAKGGLVFIAADDVGNYTTHSEQDNRLFARMAYMPVFEPSEPAEAKEMAKTALECSEEWEQPIMLRTTTRLAQSSRDVVLGKLPKRKRTPKFERAPHRWIDLPHNAKPMRGEQIVKLDRVREMVSDLPFNRLEGPGFDGKDTKRARAKRTDYGIIASGITYGYVKEALAITNLSDKVNVLKIGTPYPIPDRLVEELLLSSYQILVVEELEPFVEMQVRNLVNQLQFPNVIRGKDLIPTQGELSTLHLLNAITNFMNVPIKFNLSKIGNTQSRIERIIPKRLPVLCAGCGYRPVYLALNLLEKKMGKGRSKKWKDKISGGIIKPSDIGCTTLGVQPPLYAVDTNFCMGASIGISSGLAHTVKNPIVCAIGDSTFFHAGVPPLLNAVFNKANITVIVVDNLTTAMTGYQPNPGTGKTATGSATKRILIEDIASACGVEFVKVIDPYKIKDFMKILDDAIKFKGPSVIVARRPCRLLEVKELGLKGTKLTSVIIDRDKCTNCQLCVSQFGCPAMYLEDDIVCIDEIMCNGCGVCTEKEVCPQKAIFVKRE
jgi:indolepyruvate ferredoxin oxidoreductase alpha subunit